MAYLARVPRGVVVRPLGEMTVGGITGEVAFRGAWADAAMVGRMTQALAAEAPVDPGICDWGWVAVGHGPPEAGNLPGAGAQSMLDERLGWCLVFDGHLDNGTDLRKELGECFPFRSGSDAEVVLAAYHRWGEHFVDNLQGAFALALVDAPREKVVLARDRRGSKLLYLYAGSGRLLFASTLSGLLAAGGIDTSIDRTALRHYLDSRCVAPAPRTIFAGISMLPPATIRVVEGRGRARDRVYSQDDGDRPPGEEKRNPRDGELALYEELCAAVEMHGVADAPVGALLPAGGIDRAGSGGRSGDGFDGLDRVAGQWLQRRGMG